MITARLSSQTFFCVFSRTMFAMPAHFWRCRAKKLLLASMLAVAAAAMVLMLPATILAQDAASGASQTTQTTTPRKVRKLALGAFGAYSLNFHAANFPELPGAGNAIFSPRVRPDLEPGNFTGSNAGSLAFGIMGEYSLSPEISVGLRIGYNEQTGAFSTTWRPTIGHANGTSETAQIDYKLNTSLATLGFEPFVGYRVWEGLTAYLGARVSIPLSSSFNQSENLVSPADGVFNNGRRVANERSDALPDLQSVYIAAVVGLGYDIGITERLSVVPEAYYGLNFLTVVRGLNWTINDARFGVAVKYRF